MRVFVNEKIPVKKAEITAAGDILHSSPNHHSFAKVHLVSLIINFMWGERRNFEINKSEKG